MSEIRAVLFDFGGVLAEEGFSNGLQALAIKEALAAVDITAEGTRAAYDGGFVLGTGSESGSGFWSLLRERTGLRVDAADLSARMIDGFVVRPWMLELVQQLGAQGLVTGILSDQVDWLDRLDAKYHFYRYFDHVYNSYCMGKGKRDPSLFYDVAADLGLATAAILFIDDSAANVDRARAAGMQAVHYVHREGFLLAINNALGSRVSIDSIAR